MYFWALEENYNFRATFTGHLPSVIFTVLALVIGFQIWLIGLLADLIAASRRLTEETLYRVKRMELELSDLRERGQMIVERLADGQANGSPNGLGAQQVDSQPERATEVAKRGH
jgi:hypothetical protein